MPTVETPETTDITVIIERVMRHEGGYVNHPADPGGETHYGITKSTAREYGYHGQMRHMSAKTAQRIYRQLFEEQGLFLFEDYGVALMYQLFDACVNHGYRHAMRILQRALNVHDDGIVGPITLEKLYTLNPTQITVRFIAERLRFYTRLRTFKHFGRGWSRRISDNLAYAAEDLKYVKTISH